MSKFATNSWQAREALMDRAPYTTGGSMYATAGPTLPTGHRLPIEWQRRYLRDESEIIYTVVSYRTPIAWVKRDGSVVKVDYKWSRTTSGHQGLLYALDASRDQSARIGIRAAAGRERQAQRDRRAERRAEHGMSQYAINASRSSVNQEGFYADLRDAMRSEPQDYDALISEVQGMVVR